MAWSVETTEQFDRWWGELDEDERGSIDGMIRVLESHGPFGSPYSVEISGTQHAHLRQLRVPHAVKDFCVFYVPEARRTTLVLITGMAAGQGESPCPPDKVAQAEAIYDEHIAQRDSR